jgi:superfamily II DNA or RNA helicase
MGGWRPRDRFDADGPFDADDAFDDDDLDLDEPHAHAGAIVLGAQRYGGPDRLTWKQHLDAVDMSMAAPDARPSAWSAERELVYVVDVARSARNTGLIVDVRARERDAGARLRVPGLRVRDITLLRDPADRQILTLVVAAADQYAPWRSYDQPGRMLPRQADVSTIETVLLPMMCATGRCFVRAAADLALVPLVWDGGGPWTFVTAVGHAEGGHGNYRVGGAFRRGTETAGVPMLITATGLVFWPGRVGALADPRVLPWIIHLTHHGPITVPAAQGENFLQKLVSMPVPLELELPDDLRYEEVRIPPGRRLRVRAAPREWGASRVRGELSFDYGGRVVAASTPGRGLLEPDPRRLIVRDVDAEREGAAHLAALGFRPRQYYAGNYESKSGLDLPASKLPRVVTSLLGRGWHVEADGKLYRQPGAIRIDVTSGVDWFDVKGTVRFGEAEAALPALLAAARRGESFVVLGDGSYGMLPEQWLAKHGRLASLGTVHGDGLRFGHRQIGVLDALLSTLPDATCDDVFARARDALGRFDGIHPSDPSTDFTGRLREYQRDGLGWLHFLRGFGFGGCLADDMGLGKTVQVLALLDARREERQRAAAVAGAAPAPSLVVMPRSLIFNWKEEAARFTPKLSVLDHTGAARLRTTERLQDYDVVLTTYGTLRRDAARLRGVRFDYVVLDEAQAIKNAQTDAAKAARLLRADHRLALSGTPVQNHLGELWSLFEFLNPGMLGSAAAFGLTNGARQLDPDTQALLGRALRPFVLRRTKAQVAPELPARIEQTLSCELEGEQRVRYVELREHYRRALLGRVSQDGVGRSAIQVLEALLRLRQAACHLGLIDRTRAGDGSAKLEVLLARLGEVAAEGHQALVFSQFTSFLAIVRERLTRAGIAFEYLDGRTRDRGARVERFQANGERTVFLISLTAGGLGLNLTAAEYVFLLDPWWNPAVEAQAIDRAHRIGQTRTVCAYRVIARDTVEDKILELQQTKRDLASALITGDNSLIRSLTAEDLQHLLS